MSEQQQQKQIKVKLNFASFEAPYVSQFNVQAGAEELYVNLGTNLLPGNTSDEFVLPVHTRLAMNYRTAKRLTEVLHATIKHYEKEYGKIPEKSEGPSAHKANKTTASFPKMKLE